MNKIIINFVSFITYLTIYLAIYQLTPILHKSQLKKNNCNPKPAKPYNKKNSLLIFLFHLLAYFIEFFTHIRSSITFSSLRIVVMIETVATSPRALWFTFRRWIQTTHMIFSITITTA